MSKQVDIYTDGGARPINDANHAGAGIFIDDKERGLRTFITVPLGDNTNNHAELMGVITGLEHVLTAPPATFTLFCDSRYVLDNLKNSLHRWENNGWLTRQGQEVKNRGLWEKLSSLMKELNSLNRKVRFQWVKGHSDNEGNVKADKLATEALVRSSSGLGTVTSEETEESLKEKKKKLVAPTINPLLAGKYLFFITGGHSLRKEGEAGTYFSCTFDKDDRNDEEMCTYFAKPSPTSFFSVLRTKKEENEIESLKAYQEEHVDEGDNQPVLIFMNHLSEKSIFNDLLEHGMGCVAPKSKTLRYWDKVQLTRLMSPALLSRLGEKIFTSMHHDLCDIERHGALEKHTTSDITDDLFEVDGPKQNKLKMRKELGTGASSLIVKVDVDGKKKDLILSFGIDMPPRNNLAKYVKTNPDTRVEVLVRNIGEKLVSVKVLVRSSQDTLLCLSPQSSIRILP